MGMENEKDFLKVIELSVKDLKNYIAFLSDESLKVYAEAILRYMQGDLSGIADLSCQNKTLEKLIRIRQGVLAYSFSESEIDELKNSFSQLDPVYKGEYAFLLGEAYGKKGFYKKAKPEYQNAFVHLKKIGCRKKAVKSLLNVVATETRINPDKKLVFDYENVAEQALEIGCNEVAGICFLNISREFHIIGSLELALKYIDMALKYLEDDKGADHYYTAVVHRCHVYLDLGYDEQAHAEYQLARLAPFPHIKEALKAIKVIMSEKKDKTKFDYLEPTWRERLEPKHDKSISSKIKLTKTEAKLVKFLSQKKADRFQIMEHLYGKVDFESAYDRFRTMLTRLNKKKAGLIEKDGEFYSLAGNKSIMDNLLIPKVS